MRFRDSRVWFSAVLAVVGLLSGCGIFGPHSVVTTCLTGEVVGSAESGNGPLANFFEFPGPFRAAQGGSEDTAASAVEFTVTNDTGGVVQVAGLRVVTYSASGRAIGTSSLSPGPITNGDLLGRDMSPGQSYNSDPIPDPAITNASGRFDESDSCKVFVNWSNPNANQF